MSQPRDPRGRFDRAPHGEPVGVHLDDASGGAAPPEPPGASRSDGWDDMDPRLLTVLESAARLQQLVPDAVLVGGTAAAYYARHRISFDHHVLTDLRDRFDITADALDREPDWIFNRAVPGKITLGSLGQIEAGVRQLIRRHPLEVEDVPLPSGITVRVPTLPETLRIKAFLIVKRNQVRDYLDVAALSATTGVPEAAEVLAGIDAYYSDTTQRDAPVASQVLRQLGAPRPKDSRSLRDLPRYKGIAAPWDDWTAVEQQLKLVANRMIDRGGNP